MVNCVLLMEILLRLYFLQVLDFLVRGIFLEEGIIHFFGNLSTETDLAKSFDLVKCIAKNKCE